MKDNVKFMAGSEDNAISDEDYATCEALAQDGESIEELKNPEQVPENKKVVQKEFKKRNRNRKRNSKSRKYYQRSK